MLSSDYRLAARNALRGNWGISILVTLVASILGGTNFSSFSSSASNAIDRASQNSADSFHSIPPAILGILLAVVSLLVLLGLVVIIIGGAVRLGFITYNIDLLTRRRPPLFGTLFSRFNMFGKAFVLNLLIGIFTALWMLLFIVPGIIASYRYSMAPYLMAENPNLSPMEAIELSKEMMKGHKWRLFVLELSFFGWAILCVLTLGIGALWLTPYISVSEAAFFLDLASRNAQNPGNFTEGPYAPSGPDIV